MRVGMVVSDLDGTLFDSQRRISSESRATLVALGRSGVIRVIATGRSLFSACEALSSDLPIDYLVHTSGAGVMSWPQQESLSTVHMPAPLARSLAARLITLGVDFMLHRALPDNHHFLMHRSASKNADFDRRLRRYGQFAAPLRLTDLGAEPMCNAVVIEPSSAPSRHAELLRILPEFTVIRATSPLDHSSRWFEIFPIGATKGRAAAWLCARAGHSGGLNVAVGNDYNDIGLLDWADLPYVVANAPEELRARYPNVASNDANGFTEAVQRALGAATQKSR
jgi:hydroxymethylpyrimidine pyrophosphatase-like HAD family hydrolase